MDQLLCTIEVARNQREYILKIESDKGGAREYKSQDFEEVLEQAVIDLQEEFEE